MPQTFLQNSFDALNRGIDQTYRPAPVAQNPEVGAPMMTHYGYERPGDPNYDANSAAGIGDRQNQLKPGLSVALTRSQRAIQFPNADPTNSTGLTFTHNGVTYRDDDTAPESDNRIDVYDPHNQGIGHVSAAPAAVPQQQPQPQVQQQPPQQQGGNFFSNLFHGIFGGGGGTPQAAPQAAPQLISPAPPPPQQAPSQPSTGLGSFFQNLFHGIFGGGGGGAPVSSNPEVGAPLGSGDSVDQSSGLLSWLQNLFQPQQQTQSAPSAIPQDPSMQVGPPTPTTPQVPQTGGGVVGSSPGIDAANQGNTSFLGGGAGGGSNPGQSILGGIGSGLSNYGAALKTNFQYQPPNTQLPKPAEFIPINLAPNTKASY